jgi:hypothetical protein
MPPQSAINLKENLKDKFVAFLDVMGFSNLVNGSNIENLEAYFEKIKEILDQLKQDKAQIESFLISDSIILIAPSETSDFVQLLWAIRRIQNILLWKKIILRGAVSFGQVYYNKERNIIVGKGFIRAYLLEKEAIFPRVIIDPSIIKKVASDKTAFLMRINEGHEYNFEKRLIYTRSQFSRISDDGIFIDYANKSILEKSIDGNIDRVYNLIVENLYSEQKLYSKYVWLRDYFLEILKQTYSTINGTSDAILKHKKEIDGWIKKFERL